MQIFLKFSRLRGVPESIQNGRPTKMPQLSWGRGVLLQLLCNCWCLGTQHPNRLDLGRWLSKSDHYIENPKKGNHSFRVAAQWYCWNQEIVVRWILGFCWTTVERTKILRQQRHRRIGAYRHPTHLSTCSGGLEFKTVLDWGLRKLPGYTHI